MFLDCERNPGEILLCVNMHRQESNPKSRTCEATVITTEPPYYLQNAAWDQTFSFSCFKEITDISSPFFGMVSIDIDDGQAAGDRNTKEMTFCNMSRVLYSSLQDHIRDKLAPVVFVLNVSLHEPVARVRKSLQNLDAFPVFSDKQSLLGKAQVY